MFMEIAFLQSNVVYYHTIHVSFLLILGFLNNLVWLLEVIIIIIIIII